MRATRLRHGALTLALAGASATVAGAQEAWHPRGEGAPAADSARLATVAERGAAVMPFDLDRTLHRFEPSADGGVQTVTARDAVDSAQVELVRAHLRHEAGRFAEGDFSDPAAVHGERMPGLAELSRGAAAVAVRFEPVPAGGRIRYSTRDPALVDALHRWFAAQVSDHGRHAAHGSEPPGP